MKEAKFDRKKVIGEMKDLKNKRISEIEAFNMRNGIETEKEEISGKITVKYLGKMGIVNELGELVDKDVFMTIETINGILEIRYYDENQNLLARQATIDSDIIPSEQLSDRLLSDDVEEKEQAQETLKKLEETDKEKAKTLEQLEEEQKEEDKKKGPQLTQKQVDRLTGPKIDLTQQVDNMTLANKIGLEGKYIQFVDIEAVKDLGVELDIAELGQRFVPIEISSNGTANVVGEDKMQFSTIEGGNSTKQQTTMNNDGTERKEQGIVSFNIRGTNNCMTIGWDDEMGTSSPFYEVSFGTRDIEKASATYNDELQTVHEGPIKSDAKSEEERRKNTEGVYEASKEVVTERQAEEYAKAKNYYSYDIQGNIFPDIERATKELEEMSKGSDHSGCANVEEIIERAQAEKRREDEEAKVPGPSESPRRY